MSKDLHERGRAKLREVVIAPFASWFGLAVLGGVLVVGVGWGFFGSVDRTVAGEGLIVRDHRFGIMDVESVGSGPIADIAVDVGQSVLVGDAVAVLDLAVSREQIQSAEAALAGLVDQDKRLSADEAGRMAILERKRDNQIALFERGLITRGPVLQTKAEIEDLRNRGVARKLQIQRQEGVLVEKRLREKLDATLLSEHAGRVIEVVGVAGSFISAGSTIVRLESETGPIEAIVFLSAQEGKKVRPGMDVRIAPSTVRPEEYGYMRGRVARVSAYPVTKENVVREIRNDRLADRLLKDGAAIEIIVEFESDARSASGFRWTKGSGPAARVESGTLCKAVVVLHRERPVTLVIPFLKRFLPMF
jgi:HlyD family secretion protein